MNFNFFKKYFNEKTVWPLIIANIVVIITAYLNKWNVFIAIWSYWLQSVIIGVFQVIRIIALKNFSTAGFSINNVPADNIPADKVRRITALFFAFHYGFFHLIYFIFLIVLTFAGQDADGVIYTVGNYQYIFLNGLIFLFHYLYNYFYYRNELPKKPNIGTLMFEPYLRIIPVHIVIVLFFYLMVSNKKINFSVTALVVFLLLKGLNDIITHYLYQKRNFYPDAGSNGSPV